ncbi:ribosome maturation factor RimM [Paenibacillus sp. SC116]|uniref:ribosome maturation factor RimM n=1 Tax=Paenibacillus sp. SC116 TaxID=2968986 RepID=UPI00215A92D2|nr:ribosome maturation factor RimM [Paenibacillus sp. SC116]MCR8845422.1 ribosome maturation factor RimM [Paenibacillus sp. SC116]
MNEKLITVGEIVNTQGIRGEIKIVPHTDFPEVRFAKNSQLFIVNEAKQLHLPVTVEKAREHKKSYIVKMKEYDNINDVEKYKGCLLKVSEDQQVKLEKNEFYYRDIIGCRVVSDEGEELGVIKEILSPGANDVWVVKRPKGSDLLLPYIEDVVLDINVQDKLVKVHLMEGLL